MKDKFLDYWFSGFNKSIELLDDEARVNIFRECGKACSDSYTKQIYIEEYNAAKSLDDFLDRLKNKFPEVSFKIIKENEIIELIYNYCACDLVKDGYITSPLICECSRQSLLYNWGTVFGEQNIEIELLKSILNGDECCRFQVTISNNTNKFTV